MSMGEMILRTKSSKLSRAFRALFYALVMAASVFIHAGMNGGALDLFNVFITAGICWLLATTLWESDTTVTVETDQLKVVKQNWFRRRISQVPAIEIKAISVEHDWVAGVLFRSSPFRPPPWQIVFDAGRYGRIKAGDLDDQAAANDMAQRVKTVLGR